MVVPNLDIIENCYSIVSENRSRAVKRNQIGRKPVVADAFEADGEPWALFACKAWLEQPYDALLALADANQENLRLRSLTSDPNLVRRHDGDSAPCEEGIAEERDGRRRH